MERLFILHPERLIQTVDNLCSGTNAQEHGSIRRSSHRRGWLTGRWGFGERCDLLGSSFPLSSPVLYVEEDFQGKLEIFGPTVADPVLLGLTAGTS